MTVRIPASNPRHPRIIAGSLALMLLAVSGCGLFGRGAAVQEQAVPVRIHITGQADLNGGGNAAFVQVYQLADNSALRNALPESFWQSPEQSLGDALLAMNQIQLFPGSEEALMLELAPGARYLGIAANLRAPDRDRWRAILAVDELGGRTVGVTVDSNTLSAELQ